MLSENDLKKLAEQNPGELIKILQDHGRPRIELTFGAEYLGELLDEESAVVPVLKKLLRHQHALVREGALIGLDAFYGRNSQFQPSSDILAVLRSLSVSDPSKVIKEFASGILEDWSHAKNSNPPI